mgnify:FL=1|tara:strand:+ start:3418 stop:4791 length:1374 start_codon:yes stop_codon:yes gene_type:complete
MSLTIDSSNDSDLEDTFTLTEADVKAATVTPTTDASVILRTLVLKMLQSQMKNSRRFTRQTVRRDFRILMSLTKEDFKTEEEFAQYKKYIGELVEKALSLPVAKTVDELEDNLPGKKGSAMFELFGGGSMTRDDFKTDEAYEEYKRSIEGKPSPVATNIREKDVTFQQLLLPAYLGQTYEGSSKTGKPSKVMETVDKDKSLFDESKIGKYLDKNESDASTKGKIFYTWDLEAYLKALLKDDGFDDFDSDHLRLVPNKEKETATLNSTRMNTLLGINPPKMNITMRFDGERNKVIPSKYTLGDREYDAKVKTEREKAAKYLLSFIKLTKEQEDKIAKEILERSNFMKARRTRDRDKKMRGAGREPTVSELTRNYLDLDVGKMTFVISVSGYQSILKGTISAEEKQDVLDYGLILDKTGELRLAEEGAFAITERDKVEGISDIVRGVKTFMAKTRKFRS